MDSHLKKYTLQGPFQREGESRRRRFRVIWLPLFLHSILSLVVMLLTALFVNGYHALAYLEQSRHQEEGLVLRPSDITTILSIATKILDYLRLSWTGMIGWRLAFIALETQGLEIKHLSNYLNRLPPLKWPRRKEWLIAVILLFLMPQPFISPAILGSVDWSPAIKEGKPITVASAEPTASGWYWYLEQSPNRQVAIRTAGGMASRAWGAEDSQHSGTSRHVMPTTAPVNSTLLDAVLPSIQIHNITWATGDTPDDTAIYARQNASQLSLVNDSPFNYIRTGVGLLFNPGETWNTKEAVNIDHDKWKADFPQATKWTGSMTVFMTLSRQQAIGCQTIKPNAFGDSSYFDHLRAFPGNNNEVNETCIAWGTVHFTAGTIKASRSKFVTPQVVEYNPSNDTTLGSEVADAIEPSIWTREAMWLLPDTMAQVAVMNTSQLPTWGNLDSYTETLIRISYLANWDTLHTLYDDEDSASSTILPAQPRLRASVYFPRLYAWYGATLLLPVMGIILKYLHRSCKRGIIADEVALLFSDTSEVTNRQPDLTAMTTLSQRDEEMRPMVMRQSKQDEGVFKIGFRRGSGQTGYLL